LPNSESGLASSTITHPESSLLSPQKKPSCTSNWAPSHRNKGAAPVSWGRNLLSGKVEEPDFNYFFKDKIHKIAIDINWLRYVEFGAQRHLTIRINRSELFGTDIGKGNNQSLTGHGLL